MNKTNDSVIEKMLSPIGKPVEFSYPENEGKKRGILKDRTVVRSNPTESGVLYWDVIDLIQFTNEPKPLWIRIGYYRETTNHLVWGSQTTICEPIDTWKRLFVQTAKEKEWFKELILEVAKEVK
jgi:hypothetical protein